MCKLLLSNSVHETSISVPLGHTPFDANSADPTDPTRFLQAERDRVEAVKRYTTSVKEKFDLCLSMNTSRAEAMLDVQALVARLKEAMRAGIQDREAKLRGMERDLNQIIPAMLESCRKMSSSGPAIKGIEETRNELDRNFRWAMQRQDEFRHRAEDLSMRFLVQWGTMISKHQDFVQRLEEDKLNFETACNRYPYP